MKDSEIMRLKSMNQAKLDLIHDLRTDLEMANMEIERLQKIFGEKSKALTCAEVRVKAINEFAERLIELYTDEHITDEMHCSIGVIKQNIYDVKKIMVGENK